MAQNGDMEQLARDMAAGKPPDAEAASKMMEALDETRSRRWSAP